MFTHNKFLKTLFITMAFFIDILNTQSALASGFCVEKYGIAPQCSYHDAVQCLEQAKRIDGRCVLGDVSHISYLGEKNYCAVYPNHHIECIFDTMEECHVNTRSGNALCLFHDKN